MAEDISTGSVAAPAAAASSTASAPSTATASTDTSSAAATTSATETSTATTEAPVSGGLTMNDGESDQSFLARVMAEKSKTPEEAAAATTSEENPAGDPNAVDDPNAAKTEDAADATAEAEDFDAYDPYAEEAGPLPPTELNAKINANPALKAALDADPELKNTLFATSRLASETAKYREVFTNPEEARIAAQGNQEFSALSDLVTSIDKPEDAQGFYARLMELSVLQDDDGNPIIDQASGKPVSDGTVGRLIHHTGALFLNHFEQVAKAEGKEDPELAAAVDILKARAFGRGTASTHEDMTEEQQARAQELDTRENALKEQAKTQQATKVAEYENKIVTSIDTQSDKQIGELLARSDLAPEKHAEVTGKIRAAVYELVTSNPAFHREQDALMRRQMGAKTQQERIALGNKWFNTLLPKVSLPIIAAEGAKVMEKQGKRNAAQAARVEASRSEAAASLGTSKPVQLDAKQFNEKVMTDLTAKLGRSPETHEVLAEVMRQRTAA